MLDFGIVQMGLHYTCIRSMHLSERFKDLFKIGIIDVDLTKQFLSISLFVSLIFW